MSSILQDVRYAMRQLRKAPGFTITAVLTLALGISVNGTMFSFTSAVFLRKPPVADPDRAMVVYTTSASEGFGPNLNLVSSPNYFTWKKANDRAGTLSARNGRAMGLLLVLGAARNSHHDNRMAGRRNQKTYGLSE